MSITNYIITNNSAAMPFVNRVMFATATPPICMYVHISMRICMCICKYAHMCVCV